MKLLNLGCGARAHPDWVNVDVRPGLPGVLVHDLAKPLPFPAAAFDVVYHSHVLEHLHKADAPAFLAECHRVLAPGGVLRVAVPDLERLARTYLQLLDGALAGDRTARDGYEWIVIELFDQMVRNVSGGEMLAYWGRDPMPAEALVFARAGSEAKNWITSQRGRGPTPVPAPVTDPAAIGRFRLSGEIHQWMYDRYSLGRLLEAAGFREIAVCDAATSRIPGFGAYLLDVEPDGAVRKPDSLFMEAVK